MNNENLVVENRPYLLQYFIEHNLKECFLLKKKKIIEQTYHEHIKVSKSPTETRIA